MLYMDDAAGAVKGGNASVYRAYDDERLSTVVLKVSDERKGVLREEGCTKSTEAAPCSSDAMLRSEYDFLTLLAMRGCSCVPKPYALRTVYAPRRTEIHKRACLEMQRLEGVTLADALEAREKTLSEFQAAYLAYEVMRAGAQVQRCGVLHRDVHPGNVLLGSGGVYLIDFGTACTVEAAERGDALCLTSGYEPPEARVGGLVEQSERRVRHCSHGDSCAMGPPLRLFREYPGHGSRALACALRPARAEDALLVMRGGRLVP